MKKMSFFLLIVITVFEVACKQPADTKPDSDPTGVSLVETVFEDVDPEAAEKLLAGNVVTVLDVRTPEEFAEGHLPNAVNIDFRDAGFSEALAKLDRSKPYLIHCRSGGRSGQALSVFKELGFAKIHHLNDGILGWTASGRQLSKQ